MDIALTPVLRCLPLHSIKVWGGLNLLNALGKTIAFQQQGELSLTDPVGESWEIADLRQGSSFVKILDEEFSLSQVVCREPELFHGLIDGRYPLLIKTLDAAKDLSIQVHPGEEHLHLFEQGGAVQPKDECWFVLSAEHGGAILHGFKPGVTRESFELAIREGEDLSVLMRRHEVSAGELIHVPPGTVHAICAGVTLLEVQQPSDTTFRVWDYERPGLDGNLRPLHLEDALKVLNFDEQPPLLHSPAQEQEGPVTVLIETKNYRLSKVDVSSQPVDLSASLRCDLCATSLFVLSGQVSLHVNGQGDMLSLSEGEFSLCTTHCTSLSASTSSAEGAALILIESL